MGTVENCNYCKHSYLAGDEILCIGFKDGKDCPDFELADYFLEDNVTKEELLLHEE